MEVKEAVARAKRYVGDLFAEEQPSDLGLEEVEFDDASGEWRVTIGFARPWEKDGRYLPDIFPLRRAYKVVRIADGTGVIKSVKTLAHPS